MAPHATTTMLAVYSSEAPSRSTCPRQVSGIGDNQDDEHQDERHHRFRHEGDRDPRLARNGHDVVDGRIGQRAVESDRDEADACQSARELGEDIEHRVPRRDLAETPERQRHRWVDVSARLFPPRRVNDGDGRETHRQAHQQAADDRVWNRLPDRRGRIFEHDRHRRRRDHEEAEPGRFHQVFGPVLTECAEHRRTSLAPAIDGSSTARRTVTRSAAPGAHRRRAGCRCPPRTGRRRQR